MYRHNAVGRVATAIATPAIADFEVPTTENLVDGRNHNGARAGDQCVGADIHLPVGGTTGLSHEHSAAIDQAAEWLASVPEPERPRPIVPHLQHAFGLTAIEAVQAIREARLIQARAI